MNAMSDGTEGSVAEQETAAGSLADAVDDYRRIRSEIERGVRRWRPQWTGDSSRFKPPYTNCSYRQAATSSSRTKAVTRG
jgi:hypothetical protein